MLTANQQPDHSPISEFRCRNLDALKGLFVQILCLCKKAGMVSLGHVALILDAQLDKRYGKGKLGSDLPDELRCRQDRRYLDEVVRRP